MKRVALNLFLLAGLLISAARAQAPDATEAIKPFVNEFTVAVARVDLGAINFDALDRWSGQVLDAAQFDQNERAEVEQDLKRNRTAARQWAADFKKAGGSTVWVVVSLESLPDAPMFMVVPTGQGANVQQIRASLAPFAPGGPDHAEILQAHNAIVIASDRGGLGWIKSLKPAHQGCHASRDLGGIDHQDDGEAQELCHCCRAARFGFSACAVEEPHHSFHDTNVSARRIATEDIAIFVGWEHPSVQVAG